MDAIQVAGLTKRYGQITAVNTLDLTVIQGEIFGLLGANGAGKTTLIKALIGLLAIDAGSVHVLGFDPVRQARALRREIGYMPQSPVLYDDLTARDNVRFWGRVGRTAGDQRRVDDVLELVNLTPRADDPVHTFSGGMKQRLSLACALVHQPRLLLLDEPTTGVDPKLRQTFWQTFREMTRNGATILLSTHQMDEAVYCDRLAVMREGRILACDTPAGLFARGSAAITIQSGEHAQTASVHDYPTALPELLRPYHLDPAVQRIEVQQESLESIVLTLINQRAAAPS